MRTIAVTRRVMAAVLVLSFLSWGAGSSGTGSPQQAALALADSDTPIAAASAFDAGCNGTDLNSGTDTARNDPIWTPIIHDPNNPLPKDPPTILEGTVATPQQKFGAGLETSSSQAPSEVAEEDLPWNHYTHDKTIDVIPDAGYNHLLSSWVNTDGSVGTHNDMEVEWDNASLMSDNRTWGAEPEFVWPSVRDRVWIDGRWVFDCGHPGSTLAVIYDKDHNFILTAGDSVIAGDPNPLQFFPPSVHPDVLQPDPLLKYVETDGNSTWEPGETLIYDTNADGVYDAGDFVAKGTAPALGTQLQSDSALTETVKSYPVNDQAYAQYSSEIHPPRAVVTFRLNHPVASGSWLPVTGPRTSVPVTEADAFFSGNGGGANDRCHLINRHINAVAGILSLGLTGIDSCTHTGPVIPINDRNYVFDIYPPGTDYNPANRPDLTTPWPVSPPSPDSSLQWRVIDQSDQLPGHTCGNTAPSNCIPVTPLLCPIDASTPAPDQTEFQCPTAPANPTRLRVILPFAGSSANYFAKTILLGWDNVPAPPALPVRTFQVRLHNLTVDHNGESFIHSGDWRVFVDVGGQWRYMSNLFDRNGNGDNACSGTSLDQIGGAGGNGDGDCFRFDNTPWTVTVQNGTLIHVAVGGWESDSVDSDFCPQSDTGSYIGCDPSVGSAVDLAAFNNDRIGTYEFDLSPPDYSAPVTFTTKRLDDGEQYTATFSVQEVSPPSPPTSNALSVGNPQYTNSGTTFVLSTTPLNLSTASTASVGFQYRYYRDGTPLPTYSTGPPAVHWTSTDFAVGPRSVPVYLNANDGADGPYSLQYSAQTADGITEPRHTAHLTLDNTAPTATISQPTATNYTHSQTLMLNYNVSDGAGSGVKSVTTLLDGSPTTPAGQTLQSGLSVNQSISLLTSGLSLGPHTLTVTSVDNLGNSHTQSVTFSIIVTAQSIIDDVTQFVTLGMVTQNEGTSLISKLSSAAKARTTGNCANAATIYQSFVSEVQAQTGKKITPAAAAVLIMDAQYLIAHCP